MKLQSYIYYTSYSARESLLVPN